jgi:hypothetical protein
LSLDIPFMAWTKEIRSWSNFQTYETCKLMRFMLS